MNMKKYYKHETKSEITEKILKTYKYGSRVYGCHTEDSDYDFIVVVESDDENLTYNVDVGNANLNVYSEQVFIKKIKDHNIDALECIFQNENDEYLKYFKLDKSQLRRSISAVASNSFVKCKKKLAQGDYYIGKKSLFHSVRILGFGIQIALAGRIVDYSAYNHFHSIIMNMNTNEWDDYQKLFKPIYNRFKSNFRQFAPLEEKDNG